jgi:hypothetical protein
MLCIKAHIVQDKNHNLFIQLTTVLDMEKKKRRDRN